MIKLGHALKTLLRLEYSEHERKMMTLQRRVKVLEKPAKKSKVCKIEGKSKSDKDIFKELHTRS